MPAVDDLQDTPSGVLVEDEWAVGEFEFHDRLLLVEGAEAEIFAMDDERLGVRVSFFVEQAVAIASGFHGGAGSLFADDSIEIVRSILAQDYSPDPTIKPGVLDPPRVVAAAMELWGEVDIADVADVSGSWKYCHTPEIVTRLLHTAGFEHHRLKRLREMGLRDVEIRPGQSSSLCPACQADVGKFFPIDTAPPLPHRNCSCENSCHCSYAGHQKED